MLSLLVQNPIYSRYMYHLKQVPSKAKIRTFLRRIVFGKYEDRYRFAPTGKSRIVSKSALLS